MADSLVWKCSCGREWPEDGSGSAQSQAWRHLMDAKQLYRLAERVLAGHDLTARQQKLADAEDMDEAKAATVIDHNPVGLVDTASGAVLLPTFSAIAAQRAGYSQKRSDSWWKAKKSHNREAKLQGKQKAAQPVGGDEEAESLEEGAGADDEVAERRKGARGKGGGAKGPGNGGGKKPTQLESPFKGRLTSVNIPIRPQMYFLYIAAVAKFDGFDGSAESFAEWLEACVFALYRLYPQVFGIDKLMAMAREEG